MCYLFIFSDLVYRLYFLGIIGWKSRLCSVVFGLGVYLVVSALISTRKINFPTYDPLQQYRNLPPGDLVTGNAGQGIALATSIFMLLQIYSALIIVDLVKVEFLDIMGQK